MASSAPSEANALVECAAPIGDMPIFGLLQSATGPQQQQATANSAALKSNAAAAQLCVRSRVMSFPPVSYNLTLCTGYGPKGLLTRRNTARLLPAAPAPGTCRGEWRTT